MSTPKKGRRFNYQLEALLKVRGIQKTQEQDKFKKTEQALKEEQRKEQELVDHENAAYTDLVTKMNSENFPDAHFIQARKAYLEIMKGKIQAQHKEVEKADDANKQQREALIKAVREEKVIEKDKEKTREAWVELMKKEDTKFLDEIAIIGFENKKRKQPKSEQG